MRYLKLKAKIYYYTGIYLAHKEENEYLQSKEFWKGMAKLMSGKDEDFQNPRNAQGLLIGLWQAKHGLCRPWSLWDSYLRRIKWRVKAWMINRKNQDLIQPQESSKAGKSNRPNNK